MAFCRVPYGCVFDMGSLKMLDLAHCVMETQTLYEFVQRCTGLKALYLGYFSENLRISSDSLVSLQIWCSKLNEISVEHAPKLQNITVSAILKADRKQIIVVIKNSPEVRSITCNVWRQVIRLNGFSITEGKATIPTVKELYIGVRLSVARERRYLRNIFRTFTRMESLVLWRMDAVSSSEAVDAMYDDWADTLQNLDFLRTLRSMRLVGFKGGDTEFSIAFTALKHSSALRNLTIVSDDASALKKAELVFQPSAGVTAIKYQNSEECSWAT